MLTLDPKHLPFKEGNIVLDLGCGQGRHVTGILELENKLTVVGLDINFDDLQTTAKKIHTWHGNKKKLTKLLQASGLQLPFQDNSIDCVVCSEVLEHVHNYQQVLQEIKRVLKSDGQLCISVPRAWPEKICWLLSKEYHEVEGGHIRIFNEQKLVKEINALGMQLYKRHWAHALHAPYWWLKCLFWKQKKENFLLRAYHKLLVWDLMHKPLSTHYLEKLLNPLLGKSVVLYFKN